MNSNFLLKRLGVTLLLASLAFSSLHAADPLRVFIRAGAKTHGPGQHDHPQFLKDWVPLLNERGFKAEGSMNFPAAAQLDATDVLILFAADGMKITGDERASFEKMLKRGGGVVVLHDGVVSADQQDWCKRVIGGAWIWPKNAPEKKPTRWLESLVGFYVVDNVHPITRGVSNFDWKDEIYYDLDMASDVHVLASSFHDVHTIAPQMWTYEKTWDGGAQPYRAFVSLPGHEYASFGLPHHRAMLMRGIAWAGKRTEVDSFCTKDELASLRYPAGGPTRASEAVTKLAVHPEFNVTLCADENVAEKVMSLDWDPRGRLWVAETPEYPGGRTVHPNDFNAYPNRRDNPEKFPLDSSQDRSRRKLLSEPRQPTDRISMLEDTNGDGVMDKHTTFYEGLERVTSMVFYKDGVIVAQAPDFLWIRDTNGDGKADKVETVLTGWGIGDTHAVTSNLRWGMDGWIYGAVGYSRGRVRSPMSGKEFGDVSAGVYRFRPDGSAFEQIASEGCNTWGCEVAPDGEILFTTATCGEPICHVALPEKFLARGSIGVGQRSYASIIEENKIFPPIKHTRQPYVQIDWVGAWTAAAGACVYDGGAWPDKWEPNERYSFFMSEATMHLFHHEFLNPKGSTYQGQKEEARRETHFLTAQDYWFRPIHSRVGPDGAMYVVDFYNQIAVHNDTRSPRVGHGAHNAAVRPDRDHHFTRVYRIQHKQASTLPTFKLDAADPAMLVAMLGHPNGWVRTTANRLLFESQRASIAPALAVLLKSSPGRFSRVQALHALNNLGKLDAPLMLAALQDKDSAVRKNAARLAADRDSAPAEVQKGIQALLNDTDGRARINAVMALGSLPPSPDIAEALVAAWSSSADRFLQSAIVGSLTRQGAAGIAAVISKGTPETHADLVRHLVRNTAVKGGSSSASTLVEQLANASGADALKAVAIESLAASFRGDATWNDSLQASLKKLLNSSNPALAASVIPLVGRWDKANVMGPEIKPLISTLSGKLADPSLGDDARAQAAINLLGVRSMDPGIIPAVGKLLAPPGSVELQRKVAEALGAVPEMAAGHVLIAAYPTLAAPAQDTAFNQVLKRADWSIAFVNAVKADNIHWRVLGPGPAFRLRTHSDKSVASLASSVFDELRGPEAKEKDKLVSQYESAVEKQGDLANGKVLFEKNCAGCHKFKGAGRDLAPDLTGMGVHGTHELLIHILDPNRVVEDNFLSVSIDTKDGETYDGVVATENNTSVKLRNATSDVEIQKNNIASRRSTGRSLMPEGFEALGGDGLRDLIGYVASDDSKYRIIDLRSVFTADSTKGIYATRESTRESLSFRKYGVVKAGDIPFDIIHPSKSPNGNNVLVLKGGPGNSLSRRNPQSMDVPVGNLKASRLHILGNVAGWGFPAVADAVAVAKFTLTHADGQTESFTLTNGVHVVDYINPDLECAGSRKVSGIVTDRGNQIRLLTKAVKGKAPITKLTIESFNNGVAATFAAITLELGEGGTAQDEKIVASAAAGTPDAPSAPPSKLAGQFSRDDKVLGVAITGGGSSHDFPRFWAGTDVATLNAVTGVKAVYTDNPNDLLDALDSIEVLYLSHNKATPNPKVREGIFAFAERGGGLLINHAANWLNWPDWPEYNRQLVSGVTRGHDRFGEFEVVVTDPSHPVMKGVPATFKITDELYNFVPDDKSPGRKVLATAKSPTSGKEFPIIWVVNHGKARILCNTLGHDAKAHDLPAYQTLLKNSIQWLGGK